MDLGFDDSVHKILKRNNITRNCGKAAYHEVCTLSELPGAPHFYRIANYLELYVLGSTGDRRKQLQIINLFDDCCFSGGKTTTYGEKVSSIVQNLGPGEYELYFDRSHDRHKISVEATSLIHKIMSEVSEGSSN